MEKPESGFTVKFNPIVMAVLAFVGGMAVNAFSIARNIASVDLVNQTETNVRKYTDSLFSTAMKETDDRFKAALEYSNQKFKEALDHSDSNRKDMNSGILLQGADIKAQGVKIDLLLDEIRSIKQVQTDNINNMLNARNRR